MVHEIENFFGVYLLYCLNPKYKGRTYVGFTVDPNRRVKQHNLGSHKGGAQRTSGRGPWEMVLIVHGFPNMISALRFEWAWQNPDRSRRLRDLPKKRKKESAYEFKFRIVSEMLRTVPWRRLPLTIRWLKQNYKLDFHPDSLPPTHMAIAYGPVAVRKVGPANPGKQLDSAGNEASDVDELPSLTQISSSRPRCAVCSKKMTLNENSLKCLKPDCRMVSHTLCLARSFLASEANEVLPIEGQCPKCRAALLWGDLVRFKMGCYQNLTESQNEAAADEADGGGDDAEEDEDEGEGEAGTGSHWADDLEL